MVEGLYDRGWACLDHFLDPVESAGLLGECLEKWFAGDFHQAGVGRGASKVIREDIRRDQVLWLDGHGSGSAVAGYWQKLDQLREAINRRLFLGLKDFEGHFAVYPSGGFYKAHLDRHQGTTDRVLSAILYLNPEWKPADGGRLKLWTTPGDKEGPYEWIEPRMGTLVVFLSGDHWHEVEVAQAQRHSLTGWFRSDQAWP